MPKPPDPEFARASGLNLLAARRKSGLSQRELGERAGLHRKTIAQFELGRQTMMAETLFKLAGALGIEPAVLLDGIPPWNPFEHRFEFDGP
ncbi:MAG: helix-turn-helix domain-containing protein [Solirubrobacterales bacterium]